MDPERLKPQPRGPEGEPARPPRGISRPDDDYGSAGVSGTTGGQSGHGGGRTASPPPAAPPPPRRSEPQKSGGGGSKFLVAAVLAVILAIGYFMFGNGGTGTASSGTSSTATAGLAAETQSPAYQKHKNAVPGARASLSKSDLNPQATQAAIDAAKSGLPIPGLTSATPELVASIARGEVEFYNVRGYDTCAEDGDWITLSTSNGAKMGSFMITNAGTTFAIPVVGGQVPDVTLIADKDGVGGITVGVQTSGGTWYSGVLSPGDTQAIPMTLQ